MLKLSLGVVIAIGILESLEIVWAVYVFGGKQINKRDYFLAAFFSLIAAVLVRFMPVLLGINVIINIFILILVSVKLIKLPVSKAVPCVLITFVLKVVCETITFFTLSKILKADLRTIFVNERMIFIYGLPSIFLFAGIVWLVSIRMERRQASNKIN